MILAKNYVKHFTTQTIDPCSLCCRVGVMLDAWMLPLDDDIAARVSQPLLMVNMETFHWKKNIEQMKRLETSDVERHMITIK